MALLGRDTSISGPFPEGVLLLETLQGKEELGAPFRYDLTLLSVDPAIPSTKVLGQALTVEIKLDNGDKRYGNLLPVDPVIHSVLIAPDENRIAIVWRGSAPARRAYLNEEVPKMPFSAEW